MKNFAIFSVIALMGAVLLPSCKKNYTCSCTVSQEQYVYTYNNETKGEAKNTCDAQGKAALQVDSVATCILSNAD
jgi:hypothetical protein